MLWPCALESPPFLDGARKAGVRTAGESGVDDGDVRAVCRPAIELLSGYKPQALPFFKARLAHRVTEKGESRIFCPRA